MGIKSVLVVGYKHNELGIFSDKDIKIKIIKRAIRNDLISFLEEGAEWFLFTGNLGFEYWAMEVLDELKEEGYAFQRATIFLFENHGEHWQEASQLKLARFQQVDFIKYAYPRYENPSQFRSYNQFLGDNSDAAYIFYDPENETNLKHLYQLLQSKEDYTRKTLTFDDLNEVAENFIDFE